VKQEDDKTGDWALFEAALNGDSEAMLCLQRKYVRLLHYVINRSSWTPRDVHERADAIQETWCDLTLQFRSGEADTSEEFRYRLWRVCENVCGRYRTRANRSLLSLSSRDDECGLEPTFDGVSPDDEVNRLELVNAVKKCIDEMQEPERLLFRCKYVLDLSVKETATALVCGPPNVSKRRVPRLTRLLLTCLNRKGYRSSEIEVSL